MTPQFYCFEVVVDVLCYDSGATFQTEMVISSKTPSDLYPAIHANKNVQSGDEITILSQTPITEYEFAQRSAK